MHSSPKGIKVLLKEENNHWLEFHFSSENEVVYRKLMLLKCDDLNINLQLNVILNVYFEDGTFVIILFVLTEDVFSFKDVTAYIFLLMGEGIWLTFSFLKHKFWRLRKITGYLLSPPWDLMLSQKQAWATGLNTWIWCDAEIRVEIRDEPRQQKGIWSFPEFRVWLECISIHSSTLQVTDFSPRF